MDSLIQSPCRDVPAYKITSVGRLRRILRMKCTSCLAYFRLDSKASLPASSSREFSNFKILDAICYGWGLFLSSASRDRNMNGCATNEWSEMLVRLGCAIRFPFVCFFPGNKHSQGSEFFPSAGWEGGAHHPSVESVRGSCWNESYHWLPVWYVPALLLGRTHRRLCLFWKMGMGKEKM